MYLEGDGQLARQKQRVDKATDTNRLSFFIFGFSWQNISRVG